MKVIKKDIAIWVDRFSLYERFGLFSIGIFCTIIIAAIKLLFPHFSVSAFFYLPVFLTAIFAGRLFGILTSIFSPLAWLTTESVQFGLPLFITLDLMINAGLMLLCFLVTALLTSKLVISMKDYKKNGDKDSLTGAASRKYFESCISNNICKSDDGSGHFTIAYFDIDNFKKVNDLFGHIYGDEVLKEFTEIIQKQIRTYDILSRVGGDEFVLFLSSVPDYENATKMLDRLFSRLNEEMLKRDWNITVSVGAVTFLDSYSSYEEMLKLADKVMYEVKNNGKNGLKHIACPEISQET